MPGAPPLPGSFDRLSLLAWALALARSGPAVWTLASRGFTGLPLVVRLLFAVLWATAALPALGAGSAALLSSASDPHVLGLALLLEVFRGAALGFVAGLGLRAAEVAGLWFGSWSSPEAFGQDDAGMWRALFLGVAGVVFFRLGGLAATTSAFVESYRAWPVGAPTAVSAGLGAAVVESATRILASALALVAPVLGACWVAELAFAVMGRLSGAAGASAWSPMVRALLPVAMLLLGFAALEAALAIDVTGGLRGVGQAGHVP